MHFTGAADLGLRNRFKSSKGAPVSLLSARWLRVPNGFQSKRCRSVVLLSPPLLLFASDISTWASNKMPSPEGDSRTILVRTYAALSTKCSTKGNSTSWLLVRSVDTRKVSQVRALISPNCLGQHLVLSMLQRSSRIT